MTWTCPKCKVSMAPDMHAYNYYCWNCGYKLQDNDVELALNPTLNAEEIDWLNSIGWKG